MSQNKKPQTSRDGKIPAAYQEVSSSVATLLPSSAAVSVSAAAASIDKGAVQCPNSWQDYPSPPAASEGHGRERAS